MRLHPVVLVSAAVLALSACDMSVGRFAGIASNSVGALTITPSSARLIVGGVVQLTTNATFDQQSQVQWISLQPGVAAITPTGVVEGIAPGTATIVARLSSDTTNAGTATIVVSP